MPDYKEMYLTMVRETEKTVTMTEQAVTERVRQEVSSIGSL